MLFNCPTFLILDDKISKLDAELYIITQYHEEVFGKKVYQLHSYDFMKMKVGVKYVKPSFFNNKRYTVLGHHKLNETEAMGLIERIPRRLCRWSRGKFENLWFSSN